MELFHKEMTKDIYNTIEDKLLNKNYSYDDQDGNICNIPVADIMGKIVIIVDKTHALLEETSLDEYINLSSKNEYFILYDLVNLMILTNVDTLKEFNKTGMTICMPDVGTSPNNPPVNIAKAYGCQLIAMAFQNNDSNLEYYNSIFSSAGSAFILKPAILRFIPKKERMIQVR